MLVAKHVRDRACKEREEGEPDKLNEHGEDVLTACATRDITVTDRRDRSQDEVEGIRVDRTEVVMSVWAREIIGIHTITVLFGDQYAGPALILRVTDGDPAASHDVRDENDDQVQLDEVDVLSDHLLGVAEPAHQHFLEDQVQLLEKAVPVHESCKLGQVGCFTLESD